MREKEKNEINFWPQNECFTFTKAKRKKKHQ